MAIMKEGESQSFNYTGSIETFTVPCTGLYRLEVWGAQGGAGNCQDHEHLSSTPGGYGGYSIGYVFIKKGTELYLCIGGGGAGTGSNAGSGSGYNGGAGGSRSGGGGATHITTSNRGVLQNYSGYRDEILIAAGGGGGGLTTLHVGDFYWWNGGSGGGLTGGNGAGAGVTEGMGTGGTQTDAGYGSSPRGGFGYGAYGSAGGGGGGGFYGGGGGYNWNGGSPGGGGSGYIGGVPEITYKGTTYSPSTSNGVRSGDGLSTITLVAKAMPATLYLGGLELTGIFVGNNEIKSAFLGDKDLG